MMFIYIYMVIRLCAKDPRKGLLYAGTVARRRLERARRRQDKGPGCLTFTEVGTKVLPGWQPRIGCAIS